MPNFDPISSSIFPPVSFPDATALASPSRETSAVSDTLGVAERMTVADWMPERPVLTSPDDLPPPSRARPSSEYRLLAATEETRSLGNQIMETLGLRLQNVKQTIREVSADNLEKLKENAKKAADSSFWSVLKKIATSLLAALSIVFGISLVATGGGALIGGAMIASGVLSLANFALSETGAWDWVAKQLAGENEERRKMFAMVIPGAVGIIAGAIGIVGSVQAVVSGAAQFAEKALYIAQTALAVFDGITTFGKGIADAQLIWSQAELQKIQADLTIERTNFDSVMREIESSMNDFRAVKTKSKKIIQTLSQSNVRLVRQG
jgi:hypothetical protein